jgi:hypothetical protein
VGLEILALATDGGLAGELTALLGLFGIGVHVDPAVEPMSAAMFLEPLADDIIMSTRSTGTSSSPAGRRGPAPQRADPVRQDR